MFQKIYSKMHPVSSTNTHHDVTDLVNHGMAKNTKIQNLENGTKLFYELKIFLTCASDDTRWIIYIEFNIDII